MFLILINNFDGYNIDYNMLENIENIDLSQYNASLNMLEKIKTLGMPCGIIGKIEEKEDFEIKVI